MDDLDDNIFNKSTKKSITAPSKTLPAAPASKPPELTFSRTESKPTDPNPSKTVSKPTEPTPSKSVQLTTKPTRELFCSFSLSFSAGGGKEGWWYVDRRARGIVDWSWIYLPSKYPSWPGCGLGSKTLDALLFHLCHCNEDGWLNLGAWCGGGSLPATGNYQFVVEPLSRTGLWTSHVAISGTCSMLCYSASTEYSNPSVFDFFVCFLCLSVCLLWAEIYYPAIVVCYIHTRGVQ